MKIDLHTHCLPVSRCADYQPEEIVELYKQSGLGGLLLTNHCYPAHCSYLSDDLKQQARLFAEAYHRAAVKGAELGVAVIFGVELKLINVPHNPEFILIGISEELFIESYPLYTLNQKELFEFCNKHNILMIQAHPYRTEQGYQPADMRYLHGIEVFNPNIAFATRFSDALELAKVNKKLMTAGSDFHIKAQLGLAGMVIPDNVTNQFMLRDYLKTGEVKIFDENGVFYESQIEVTQCNLNIND